MSIDESARILADPLRARIVSLLADEALCTCHLVAETGAHQTTVSHHLRVLREAGWVTQEPCGRFTYYRLEPGAVAALASELGTLAERASATAAAESRRPC